MQDTVNISGLEPLIAPEKVGLWPPALGWYLVAGLFLLGLILLLLSWMRRRRNNRYRVLALNQLKEIRASAGKQVVQGDIQALNRLLKETALTVFPREQVAALFGKEWLEFLDQHCFKTDFANLHWKLLGTDAYVNKEQIKIPLDQWNLLIANVETWIRKHHQNIKTE